MTNEELNEIDNQVAEAIGGKLAMGIDHHEWVFPDGTSIDMNYWSPSRDWNDAVYAAEQAGLFTAKGLFSLSKSSKGQEFWICSLLEPINQHAIGDTAPLAISQAILKLKGVSLEFST